MTEQQPGLPPLQASTIADLLAATAVTVGAEVRALHAVAGWRPAPGEWSANECVGHLIEAERRGFAGRIRVILGGVQADGSFRSPTLETWDPPAVAAARHDDERAPADLADEFAALRRDSVDLVRSLTAEDLRRSGIHPEVGELRVDELIGEWVHHDRNHIRQLLAVTQSRVWDQMGNARTFSVLDLE
ncbi:MAG TPA: DinB family protein [Candidatus Limnocylindrales bacterium]|jgi:hypothetical protein|nr:DinB family protein [Candidatus Limnocylindrales bacterium]